MKKVSIISLTSTVAEFLEKTEKSVILKSTNQHRKGEESMEALIRMIKRTREGVQGRNMPLQPLCQLRVSPPFLICCVQTAHSPNSQKRNSLFVFEAYLKML